MLKKILLGFFGVVSIILIYAGLKSGEMRVEREVEIRASAEAIFPYINHSKKANEWMPWLESDPGVKMIYSGPEEGLGSKSSWDSPGQMGTGEALVIESVPLKSVKTQLTYTRPFQMSQVAEIVLTPIEGGATKVKWSVSGHNGYFFRLIGIFMDCDKMIGGEFEKGLARLKNKLEGK